MRASILGLQIQVVSLELASSRNVEQQKLVSAVVLVKLDATSQSMGLHALIVDLTRSSVLCLRVGVKGINLCYCLILSTF